MSHVFTWEIRHWGPVAQQRTTPVGSETLVGYKAVEYNDAVPPEYCQKCLCYLNTASNDI